MARDRPVIHSDPETSVAVEEETTRAKASKGSRAEIIRAVGTPLGFFTLIVLAAETIVGAVALATSGEERTQLLLGMLALLLFLIAVVALLAAFRPGSLDATRPTSPEVGTQELGPDAPSSKARPPSGVASEWYCEWRLGKNDSLFTEFLTLRAERDGRVTGVRRIESSKVTNYAVAGYARGAFWWLEYHDAERSGGGTLLLKELTSGRRRGFVNSVDCESGELRCQLNQWVPVANRLSYERTWQEPIGSRKEP